MQIVTIEEALELLRVHQTANVRDYIAIAADGSERIDLTIVEQEKLRPIRKIEATVAGEVQEIVLTNGQRARASECVYLLWAENGLTKIGYTDDIARRISALNSASSAVLHLDGYGATD
jgi:hypothetical protein